MSTIASTLLEAWWPTETLRAGCATIPARIVRPVPGSPTPSTAARLSRPEKRWAPFGKTCNSRAWTTMSKWAGWGRSRRQPALSGPKAPTPRPRPDVGDFTYYEYIKLYTRHWPPRRRRRRHRLRRRRRRRPRRRRRHRPPHRRRLRRPLRRRRLRRRRRRPWRRPAAAAVAAAARDAASEHATTVAATVAATKYPSPQPALLPSAPLPCFASASPGSPVARALCTGPPPPSPPPPQPPAFPVDTCPWSNGETTGKTDIIQCQDGMEFNIYTNCHGDGRLLLHARRSVEVSEQPARHVRPHRPRPCGGGTEHCCTNSGSAHRATSALASASVPSRHPLAAQRAAALVAAAPAARLPAAASVFGQCGLGQRLHGHARVQPGAAQHPHVWRLGWAHARHFLP